MSASGKNMKAVVEAKKDHDQTCPWGGIGVRVALHPFEIERMGWEEGDNIAGLTVVADNSMPTGTLRIECDAEPKPKELIEEEVSEPIKPPELVPA